jgi:hypothetical protein
LPRSSGRSAARHPAEIALDRVQNNLDRLSEQVDELAPMRFGDFTSRNDDRDPTPAA